MLCGQALVAATCRTKESERKQWNMSTPNGHAYRAISTINDVPAKSPGKLQWIKVVDRIRAGLRRRRQLRDLTELDDRLLADVGITRKLAIRAASKACWS